MRWIRLTYLGFQLGLLGLQLGQILLGPLSLLRVQSKSLHLCSHLKDLVTDFNELPLPVCNKGC